MATESSPTAADMPASCVELVPSAFSPHRTDRRNRGPGHHARGRRLSWAHQALRIRSPSCLRASITKIAASRSRSFSLNVHRFAIRILLYRPRSVSKSTCNDPGRGSCSWNVDHPGWVVRLDSPNQQTPLWPLTRGSARLASREVHSEEDPSCLGTCAERGPILV
jgi:hypothetical protein